MARVFTLGLRQSICCLALWAGLSVTAWAQSPNTLDQTSEQIEALRAEISVIQARLASQESERDTLQDLRDSNTKKSTNPPLYGSHKNCVFWHSYEHKIRKRDAQIIPQIAKKHNSSFARAEGTSEENSEHFW